jgi:hypothetical protein
MPPLLYLHGLSNSDFGPASEQFLGTGAGLPASSITRLTPQWKNEAVEFGALSAGDGRGTPHHICATRNSNHLSDTVLAAE